MLLRRRHELHNVIRHDNLRGGHMARLSNRDKKMIIWNFMEEL